MKAIFISHTLSLLAGGLYALCYPSVLGTGWFPLLLVALPLFLWMLETSTFKESLGLVLAYNLGLNIVGYYWIPHTLREFGDLPWLLSVVVGGSFSLILQPHWWLYALWRKFRPAFAWNSEKGVLLSAAMLTLLERYVPQQFPSYAGSPWLHLSPFLGLAPLMGTVVFSFITYWVALEVVTQLTFKKLRPQVWVTFCLFIVINALFPISNPPPVAHLPVRVVQANIGNFLKVSSEKGDADSFESINDKYYRLSTINNGFNPQLIVWPETAYPGNFYGTDTQVHQIFLDIMQEKQSEILIGGYDFDTTKGPDEFYETLFNSSILMDRGKVKASYHKNILIPFGETLPFGVLNKQIVAYIPGVSLFARGSETPLMETRDKYRFVSPICYEILESNYMRSLLNQWGDNHFIVNHTNDSWYGDTAEPYQHLFLSKWRALEFQLPIIRSTNTGITSIIYPDGTESRRLGIGESAILDVQMPIGAPQNTFYQRYGAIPTYLLALLLLLITWLREKIKV
jgi:apolipoprotein N-acyltransferase